jgi:hypothetical protein
VQRIKVDGRDLYAKVSLLGASLVSILRGRYGCWSSVRLAQQGYVSDVDNLLRREAAQLRFLNELGHRTVDVSYEAGVLFTQPAKGRSLMEVALNDPARLGALLTRAWRLLDRLHTGENRCVTINERDVTSTFIRKFGDPSNLAHRLGLTDRPVSTAAALLCAAALLRQLPEPQPGTGFVYGDLKPEHILVDQDGAMTLIDPGIMPGSAVADLGKLIGRLLLSLFCAPPQYTRDLALLGAIKEFTHQLAARVPKAERQTWWRDLIGLWLRDTLNIMSTYLAAPDSLPLPAHGTELLLRGERVCDLVKVTATTLEQNSNPYQAWLHGLAEVVAR